MQASAPAWAMQYVYIQHLSLLCDSALGRVTRDKKRRASDHQRYCKKQPQSSSLTDPGKKHLFPWDQEPMGSKLR